MERSQDYVETLSEETLQEAVVSLEALESAQGRSEKEAIILENKSNPVLQELLFRSLGREKYYIRLSENEDILSADNQYGLLDSYKKFLVALKALNQKKLKGKAAKNKFSSFLSRCPTRLRIWFLRTLNHNLRVGVSRSTVEKIYGTGFWRGVDENEFHYHGCCLAKKYEEVYSNGKEPEFPVGLEYKLDGERALIFLFPEKDYVEIVSRDDHRKPNVEDIQYLRAQLFAFSNKLCSVAGLSEDSPIFLDGEFLADNWNDTSSVVSKTKNFDEEAFMGSVKILLWDWSTIDAYVKKEFSLPWKPRKQMLMRAAGATRRYVNAKAATDNIYVLGHKIAYDQEDLESFHSMALDAGYEGTMIKVLDAPHLFHRKHKNIIKLKPEDEETGVIVDLIPGTGRHAATSNHNKSKVREILQQALDSGSCDELEDDGFYYHAVGVNDVDGLVSTLLEAVNDAQDRRVSKHLPDTVSYRYGARLGTFVVEWKGEVIHVGGGVPFKAGNDLRMEYWQQKDDLIGTKLDFRIQRDKESVAKARFNRFVRIREDI